jgi:hypothetical protein
MDFLGRTMENTNNAIKGSNPAQFPTAIILKMIKLQS